MRVTHRLSRNAEQSTPAIRLFLDCECNVQRQSDGSQLQTLRFGWIRRERRQRSRRKTNITVSYHGFVTADEAWDVIEQSALSRQLCYVYAHNWDYDAALIEMDGKAKERGWTCTRWAKQRHFLFARFAKGRKAILFVDTLNYWSGNIESLGESLGLKKLPTPSSTADHFEWDAYCIRDVDIIATFMRGLYDLASEQEWGRFKPTLAGLSWHAYRHKFMTQAPLVIADSGLSDFERKAYHGGRTECFSLARQDGPVYQLDVNSMYPSVMRDNPYPLEKARSGRNLAIDDYRAIREHYLIVADCRIFTPAPAYPTKLNGKLIFPIGEFDTTLCTPELDAAYYHGHLGSIGRYVLYTPADLFSGYVNSLHTLRQGYARRGNRPLELACKLMLNSLYGKFGQLSCRWEQCPCGYDSPDSAFTFACRGDRYPLRHIARYGEVWHQIREGESQDSIPSIAAHVTAYARMRLWALICQAGRDNVYYCDTDSLFVNRLGKDRLSSLICPPGLGKLKVVGQYDWFHAHGPKDYETSAGSKVKGVRSSATRTAQDTFAQDRFASYDTMLKAGIDGAIHVTREHKHLSRHYDKGIVADDGSVSPIRLTLG